MKVIVTGANGFVGKALVEELLNQSHEVMAVVRKKSGIPKEWEGKVDVLTIDLFSDDLENLRGRNVDVFYHLAWSATAGTDRANIDLQLENVKMAGRLLNAAVSMGCKKFVYTGSVMEYEVMQYIPKNDSKPSPNMVYSTAKLTADFMLKSLAENLPITYVNALISNIFGHGEKIESPRFINFMLRKMIKNEKLSLTSCEQLYDFVYVTDAAKAIMKAGIDENSYGTYYIGNREPKKLRVFLEKMMEVTGSESELEFGAIPYNNAYLSYDQIDTNRVFDELNITYQYSFEEGIKKMMEIIE